MTQPPWQLQREAELQAQIRRQAAQIKTQLVLLEAQKARIATDSQALAVAQAQLRAVHESTSWRALGVVRRAGNWLPSWLRHHIRRGAGWLWRCFNRRSRTVGLSADAALAPSTRIAAFDPALLAVAEARLQRFAPFVPTGYLAQNQDAALTHDEAARHALCFGGFQGRRLFSNEAIARAIGGVLLRPAGSVASGVGELAVPPMGRIGIYHSSLGNIFMREIAEDLAADLRECGAVVELLDESADMDARPPVCVFVAPHEFFLRGRGRDWLTQDIVSQSLMLNTEQIQTIWFAQALPMLLMGRGVIDLCEQSAVLLAQAGLRAVHMQPILRRYLPVLLESDLQHPLFKVLPHEAKQQADPACAYAARPLDINFFGAVSPYREQFFTRHAARLADYRGFLYCRRGLTPLSADSQDGGLSRLAAHVAAHSRITLNIHRDEFGYFEWHRIVKLGMCGGGVVVSDPCLPHPGFVPGTHYFEAQMDQIPDLLDWLLQSPDGRAAAQTMIGNVEALFHNASPPRQVLAPVLQLLREALGER